MKANIELVNSETNEIKRITGRRVYLEKLVEHATPGFFKDNLGSEEMTRYMLYVPHPYSLEDGQRFIDFLKKTDAEKTTCEMAVFNVKTGTLIGVVSFAHLDLEHGHAEMGYWIGKPYQGNHYAMEAGTLLLKYGFNCLGLERIYAYVDVENAPSITVLESLGFTREGILRRAAMHRNHYIDRCIYAIIRSEADKYISLDKI